MEGHSRTAASWAERQHGNVARRQLRKAGISAGWIERQVGKGTLFPAYPGVYRVGHAAPSVEADCMAAVLACGERAVLRGRSAAHLLGLTRAAPRAPEVMTPTERSVEGIATQRTRRLDPREGIIPCRYVPAPLLCPHRSGTTRRARYVPLLFDRFGVREVEVDVLLWPGFEHGFKPGELSGLYALLNEDDLFESCDLRANMGAEFDSERWSFDISPTKIQMKATGFATFPELEKQLLHLLEYTQKFFGSNAPFMIPDRISVRGMIPEEDPDKEVSAIVLSKLLARKLSKADENGDSPLDSLPGQLSGVGATLVGDTDDYHWHANIGPAHGTSMLPISADLYFRPPSQPPDASVVADRLGIAYEFTGEHVVEFAEKILG